VPTHFALYRVASARVMERLHALTPQVEQISIDEAFMDVTALGWPPEQLARELQRSIQTEIGLPCSLGVAGNKLVAKIATEVGKASGKRGQYPNAVCVVPPGGEAAFLEPLPASALWGVGPKTGERLADLGIKTIGDIARRSERDLARRFGKHGTELYRHARGIDDRPIVTERAARSISKETTFANDIADGAELRAVVRELAKGVARQLQHERISATTVKLKLRWPDFTTITRQTSFTSPTDKEARIVTTALALLAAARPDDMPVRLVGVGVSGLGTDPQLSLWDTRPAAVVEREQRLQQAVENVQERFGNASLTRANKLRQPPRP
jgi:DNA polymerase-4